MQDLKKKNTWIISMLSKWTWDPAALRTVGCSLGCRVNLAKSDLPFSYIQLHFSGQSTNKLNKHILKAHWSVIQLPLPLRSDTVSRDSRDSRHHQPSAVDTAGEGGRDRDLWCRGSTSRYRPKIRAENDRLLQCRAPSHFLCSWGKYIYIFLVSYWYLVNKNWIL